MKLELVEKIATPGAYRLTPINQINNPDLMGASRYATCVLTSVAPALVQPGLYGPEGVLAALLEANGPERALASVAERQAASWKAPEDLAMFLDVPDASELMKYVGRANSTNMMQYMAPRGFIAASSSTHRVRDLESGRDWEPRPTAVSRESYLYKTGVFSWGDVRLHEWGVNDPGYVRDVFVSLESTRGPFDAITFLVTTTGAGHQVLLLDVVDNGVLAGDSAGFPREEPRAGYSGRWNSPEQVEGCVWFADWEQLARWFATFRMHVLRFEERKA